MFWTMRRSSVPRSVESAAADQGFEGVTIGFGSYPIVKLEDGIFQTNDEELGKEIIGRLLNSKKKILYRTKVPEGESPEIVYTYDDVLSTSGNPIKDVLAEWEADGEKWERKEYLDVVTRIEDEESPYDSRIVLLSIPPASSNRFGGYVGELMMSGRKVADVLTRVSVGKKVTKTRFPFYPWNFSQA